MDNIFEYAGDINVLMDILKYIDDETNCDDPDPRLPDTRSDSRR